MIVKHISDFTKKDFFNLRQYSQYCVRLRLKAIGIETNIRCADTECKSCWKNAIRYYHIKFKGSLEKKKNR